jgi:hypothetical protein
VRLRGWLTISAGLALGLLTAAQAWQLKQLGLSEAARDHARELTASLRWRLELSRATLDLNDSSMALAVREFGRWPHPLEWAGLYGPGRRLVGWAGERPSGYSLSDADSAALASTEPEDLPTIRPLAGDRFLALTRLRIGERELTLAMVLAPSGWRAAAAGFWSVLSVCLAALAAAALLLVWHGTTDILVLRRGQLGKSAQIPSPPGGEGEGCRP